MLVRNQMESSRTNTNLIERTGRGVMADALRYGCIANIASAWLVLDHPFPRDLSCASPYGRTAHQVRTSVPVWTPYCPGVWIGTLSVRPPSCCRPDRTLLETAVDGRDRLVQMPFFGIAPIGAQAGRRGWQPPPARAGRRCPWHRAHAEMSD